MSQHPVFFIGFWPDYETSFLQDIKDNDREIIIVNPLEKFTGSKIHKYLPRPIRNALYLSIVKKYLRSYPTATFIFQEHRLILNGILKYGASTNSGVLMRNICDPQSKTGKAVLSLQSSGMKIFSFDPPDCKRYGFTYYNQFIAAMPRPTTSSPGYDFCFIGKNKGRDTLLNDLGAKAEAVGYTMKINFVGKAPTDHFSKQLPYLEYLDLQLDCHCIVDIIQHGQYGITLRPLEAALYQKKLISNNTDLKNHALFDSGNILIIDDRTAPAELQTFMQKTYHVTEPKMINQFKPQTVFNGIIAGIDTR